MGNELLPRQRKEAAALGWQAIGGWALSGLVFWKIGLILGAVAVGAAVWLTARWFRFRASWGMRF